MNTGFIFLYITGSVEDDHRVYIFVSQGVWKMTTGFIFL